MTKKQRAERVCILSEHFRPMDLPFAHDFNGTLDEERRKIVRLADRIGVRSAAIIAGVGWQRVYQWRRKFPTASRPTPH